jgi:Nitrile hydratase beta subunit
VSAAVSVEPDATGPAAPPRSNGELLFDEPWQARAFAMAVTLLQHNGEGWDAFRPHLVRAIEADPDAPYYESFVAALEAYVASRESARQAMP